MGSRSDLSNTLLFNAWFASLPGRPFWLLPLEYAQFNIAKLDGPDNIKPEGLTGPNALGAIVEEYQKQYENSDGKLDLHDKNIGWKSLYDGDDLIEEKQKWMKSGEYFANNNIQSLAHSVTILPWWEIYPYSWLSDNKAVKEFCWIKGKEFDEERCKMELGIGERRTHTITYWSQVLGEEGR